MLLSELTDDQGQMKEAQIYIKRIVYDSKQDVNATNAIVEDGEILEEGEHDAN